MRLFASALVVFVGMTVVTLALWDVSPSEVVWATGGGAALWLIGALHGRLVGRREERARTERIFMAAHTIVSSRTLKLVHRVVRGDAPIETLHQDLLDRR